MIIVRAGADLLGGTEITHGFTDSGKEYEERQGILRGYGIDCDCKLSSNKKRSRERRFDRVF
ncbi:hypothetical protein ABVK25_006462 [Lepraria finkii]|uniref:Uncharacterized protein n=1 Tax=Lepraria finkii TaxID=1340010 RepID=A0ABR4BBA6_9LECA